ncbi:DUF7576 family protein [Halopiger goleimassiliensis]|uniref:DUF7576 family protein n=1 Tax=Halopiger goleimassiliensis TaxID=1293048 RepID=UPI0006783420|nr:hypothetical protein [Halopiger goleimassiliensis]
MVDSNADPPTVSRLPPSDPDEPADSSLESEPADADAAADRCETCGARIGPREYRLSRIVRTDRTTVETHYCSEACFPDDNRPTSAENEDGPRDWSYCR